MPLHSSPHSSPDAVPLHRATQHFAHCESHSRSRSLRAPPVKNRDVPRKMLSAFLVDRLKV